jgi:hypothetical protein
LELNDIVRVDGLKLIEKDDKPILVNSEEELLKSFPVMDSFDELNCD